MLVYLRVLGVEVGCCVYDCLFEFGVCFGGEVDVVVCLVGVYGGGVGVGVGVVDCVVVVLLVECYGLIFFCGFVRGLGFGGFCFGVGVVVGDCVDVGVGWFFVG